MDYSCLQEAVEDELLLMLKEPLPISSYEKKFSEKVLNLATPLMLTKIIKKDTIASELTTPLKILPIATPL